MPALRLRRGPKDARGVFRHCWKSAGAVQGAEPPSSTASEASGREGRSARLYSLSPRGDLFLPLEPSADLLPSPHTSGSVDAASKPASVTRRYCRRAPRSGTMTANGFNSCSLLGDRAREHRELNRRNNPRHRSGKRGSQHCSDPPPPPWNGKRKLGRAHVVRKALCAFRNVVRTHGVLTASGKSPISRNDERASLSRTTRGRGAQLRCGKSPALEE